VVQINATTIGLGTGAADRPQKKKSVLSRSCPGFGNTGCVVSLTNGATQTTAKINGGTSGIIIDNNYVTLTGGSSIYFSSGAVPNNAVKVTQQGLQWLL
jgi:hypothetical protein